MENLLMIIGMGSLFVMISQIVLFVKSKGKEDSKLKRKKYLRNSGILFVVFIVALSVSIELYPPEQEKAKETTSVNSTTDKEVPEAKNESSENEETTNEKQEVPTRAESIGKSDKEMVKVTVGNVNNDTTGNWKLARIADNIKIEECALDYYKKYFKSDSEIHAVVNFNYNTTTCIRKSGDYLDVTIHEYVSKEEHDAKKLFGGMVLGEYFIYLDNGDIEKVR
ncbi:MAG: hypothetical protein E6X86_04930 [Clostridium butyricum]|nr:hypothetical protein [Clostridium butyricum]MDU4853564.1 hypothetical protein [Clostridioides difficile]